MLIFVSEGSEEQEVIPRMNGKVQVDVFLELGNRSKKKGTLSASSLSRKGRTSNVSLTAASQAVIYGPTKK